MEQADQPRPSTPSSSRSLLTPIALLAALAFSGYAAYNQWTSKDELETFVSAQLQPLQLQLEDQKKELAEKDKALANSAKTLADLEAQAAIDDGVIADLTKTREAMEKNMADLQQKTKLIPGLQATIKEQSETITNLAGQIAAVTQQRDEARKQVKEAKKALAEARAATIGARWTGFKFEAQLEVCYKGTANKISECRDQLTASLKKQSVRDAYEHCLRTNQAEPLLRVVEQGSPPPPHSRQLTDYPLLGGKAWFVVLCDETLPEAP